ncbi:S-layer homology domain-containing protein [Candidatus Peregrinibacteria bacterium]|nr:MAG: S-layer homology domain-containing protein [Candidatus Peregrinibacteria bacterium]
MLKKGFQYALYLFVLWVGCAGLLPLSHAQGAGTKAGAGFNDVPNSHPQYVAISYLADEGVVKGYEDGNFKPADPITRAAALKMLLAISGIEPEANATENPFHDVPTEAWFAPYVQKAKTLQVVKGNEDGSFSPEKQVNKVELIKMLAEANQINTRSFQETPSPYPDVPDDAWYKPYMAYAAQSGLISRDQNGALNPAALLSRGDAAEILYLFSLSKKGKDTQFLLRRAEVEMSQIEVYIIAQKPALAKKAADLSVDLTQQAYQNLPDHPVVIGAAKLARAYDWLVDAYILMAQGQNAEAAEKANGAIVKATEAWEANKNTQPIARHVKDVAREILKKVGGIEE